MILALLLSLGQLGNEDFSIRDTAELRLSSQCPTLQEYRILRTWTSSSPEAQVRSRRVLSRWTKRICDGNLPEGCKVYPDVDLISGMDSLVRRWYPSEGYPQEWIGHLRSPYRDYMIHSPTYNPPFAFDRRLMRAAVCQYLRETGDLDGVKHALQAAFMREKETNRVPRVSRLFGIKVITMPHYTTFAIAPDLIPN